MADDTVRCTCKPVVGTRFGGETGRDPSLAVVEALAAAEEVPPTELEPLGEKIPLDAIDRLLGDAAGTDQHVYLRFRAAGWDVFLRGDGAIRICDPECQTEPVSVFETPVCD